MLMCSDARTAHLLHNEQLALRLHRPNALQPSQDLRAPTSITMNTCINHGRLDGPRVEVSGINASEDEQVMQAFCALKEVH
eukprot:2898108-Amphidinium_carterae.1